MSAGSDRASIRQQILRLIDEARRERHPIEYDLDTLFDRLHATSMARLALPLGELVHRGQVQLLYRVVSPRGGGLADFSSPDEIPPTIDDRFNDWQPLEVTPDRVAPIYRFPCARSASCRRASKRPSPK
ncbi:MAG: hypothetical protein IT454_10475 [Planctomycetes bacterium]|nr:hypothetical protein [Planctomycetota bacterium]